MAENSILSAAELVAAGKAQIALFEAQLGRRTFERADRKHLFELGFSAGANWMISFLREQGLL